MVGEGHFEEVTKLSKWSAKRATLKGCTPFRGKSKCKGPEV